MKLVVVVVASLVVATQAFAPAIRARRPVAIVLNNLADEFGIPCTDECALESYPSLPKSVHPGVVTGQAMIDLLNHAKENGKIHLLDNR
jgi:fructose-bisphosphate aldolase class II